MLYTEEILIGVALGKVLGVGKGIEVGEPCALAVLGAKEACLCIPKVEVALGTTSIYLSFFCITHPAGIFRNGSIIVCILERLRYTFIVSICWHIA